jgi:hypothetical protein
VFLIEEIKMEDQFSEVHWDDGTMNVMDFDRLSGVTFAYAMSPTWRDQMLFHYVLTPVVTNSPKDVPRDTRGYREMSRRNGKKVPPMKDDALGHQLFVLPGAGMSPAEVVKVLRDFIARIEKHGMFIGEYEGVYIKERIVKERVEES